MIKWFSLALAVTGALVLGIWQLQRANDAKMQALQGEVRRLAKAGADASARAESVERVVPTLVRQIAAAQSAPVASAVAAAPEEPAPAEPAGPTMADQATHVESVFAVQAVDAGWARATQAHLNEHLTKQLGGATMESLECRESLCKARLEYQDAASYSAFLDRLTANANDIWKGAIVYYRDDIADERDRIKTSVYFAKEGTEFPRL